MQGSKRIISKKHIEKEIYKTFEIIQKQKSISIADYLKIFNASIFGRKKYRKIRFSYTSLIKLVLYQKLKGLKFQTRIVRYLKRHPADKFKLGFSQTPDQTTISYFLNRILGDQTKELIEFTVTKIEEISEKFGILLDIKTLEPEKPTKPTKERNQRLQKNNKNKEICRIIKRRLSPFINFHQHHNVIYTKQDLINLLVYLAKTQLCAEQGAESYKQKQRHGPAGKTILYHLKKYKDIREIQRMFEVLYEIIWDIARQNNLFNPRKRLDLAIDYTDLLYYGNRQTPMVVGTKPKDGTDSCYRYATINIVEGGKRFTLLALPVSALDDKARILARLLLYALKRVKINKVHMDRGFFDSKSISVLNHLGIRWLMPGQRNFAIRRTMEVMPAPSVVTDFKMKNVCFNLCIGIGRNGKKQVFATNIKFNNDDAKFINWLFNVYNKRWGIETSYRVKKHSFLPRTTSKNYIIRLFYFLFSVLLYNLWILVNILIWLFIHGSIGIKPLVKALAFSDALLSIDPGG